MEPYRPHEDYGDEPAIEERVWAYLDYMEVMEALAALEGPPIITFDSVAYWGQVWEGR